MGGPDVRVYVASANTSPVTELCIRTIHRYAGHPFELFVGDVGSGDGSVQMLQRLADRGWLRSEVAPGWRQHAEWLDDWVADCDRRFAVFVDSDIAFRAEGWLRRLVGTAATTGAALVCAEVMPELVDYVHPGSGRLMRVARRPSAHLMLLDVARIRALGVSFAARVVEPADVPEGRISYDVGARVLAAMEEHAVPWTVMPPSFREGFVHWGGMSWLARKLWPDLWPGWPAARKLTLIRSSLVWHRVGWRQPSAMHAGGIKN